MDKSIPEKYMYIKMCAESLNLSVDWFKDFADLIQVGWHKQYEWLGETFTFDSLSDFIQHKEGLKADPTAIYLAVEACSKNPNFDPHAKNLMNLFEQENFNPVIETTKPINKPGRPSKLTSEDRHKIMGYRLQGMTQQQIADDLEVSQVAIHKIITNVDNINISYNDNDVNKDNEVKTRAKGGTSQGYLLGRLKRDYPEVLDKIGKGKEFNTVRQAAIAVGIIKNSVMISLPAEPDVLAKNLQSKCDSEYLAEMGKSLGFVAVEGQSGGAISSDLYVKLNDQQLRELYVNLCEYLGNEF